MKKQKRLQSKEEMISRNKEAIGKRVIGIQYTNSYVIKFYQIEDT